MGVARVINKAGHSSRSQAEKLVRSGVVSVNGRPTLDPEFPTCIADQILIDGQALLTQELVYLMLNKPRGLVTSASDEQGRATIFTCLEGKNFPHVGPVGRLDKASEGLLLLTNDTVWANKILDPANSIEKIYHVQVGGTPDYSQLEQMEKGVFDEGQFLHAKRASLLRQGEKNSWLEVTLTEGKKREIRRILMHFGFETLRLIRISLGPLRLGDLPKGAVRNLTPSEIDLLSFRKTPCI